MTGDISPDLQQLLETKLDTFEKFELAMALRLARKPETLADLAVQLQVGRKALRPVAEALIAEGMVQASDSDSLHLMPGPWEPLLDEAAKSYAEDPRRLMRLFTKIMMQKLRGLSARTFADAFYFRKKSR